MADPFANKKSFVDALSHVKTFSFYTEVYDQISEEVTEAIQRGENIKPPKTRFVPSRTLIRKMMRAVAKFGNSDDPANFLLRFGLVESPIAFLRQRI